jgi:hypothetical protein
MKVRNLLQRISKETILNFVGAHPRLFPLMAALGISLTFSFVGKTMIHELLQPAAAMPGQFDNPHLPHLPLPRCCIVSIFGFVGVLAPEIPHHEFDHSQP